MALVGATIANGGTCYYPRLVDRVVDHHGQDAVDPETGKLVAGGPRVRSNLADLGLQPDQIEHIRHGMWRVVNDQGGTATKAKLKNIEVAGKTGTAEFWRNGVKDNHTWFMSFAPYKDPKIAVVVFIQGAKGGGVTAAPIAARIIEETLALEDGKKQVEVKSLEPAQGSFTFINNIDFSPGVNSKQLNKRHHKPLPTRRHPRSRRNRPSARNSWESSDFVSFLASAIFPLVAPREVERHHWVPI